MEEFLISYFLKGKLESIMYYLGYYFTANVFRTIIYIKMVYIS